MNEFFIKPGKRLYELDLCQLRVAFVMMRNQTQISQT